MRYCFLFLLIGCIGYLQAQELPLRGTWRFRIDRNDVGVQEQWFNQQLEDRIQLPGSMLTNGKGDEVSLQTKWTGSIYDSSWYFNPRMAKYRQPDNLKFPFWLTPSKYYVGVAWYQKDVEIPANKSGKHIELFLERCHTETTVWVDGKEVGMQNSLVGPHAYDLSAYCTPGRHTITIRIDNRIKAINVGPDSHSITDHTQGNWNGIIGSIKLIATPPVWIDDVQVYPDLRSKSATVEIRLKRIKAIRGKLTVFASAHQALPLARSGTVKKFVTATDTLLRLELPMGEHPHLWDEFDPYLYNLHVVLALHDGQTDKMNVPFGMREVTIKGNQLRVNGRTVFLRGTVNNCEFPLTGYPPMDKAGWRQLFRTAKEYGLNHMRFHSFCPPEAAFMAADEIGFYLQPEAPGWVNHGTSLGDGKPVDNYMYAETDRIAKWYGNHPSFIMEAVGGNEPAGRNHPRFLGRMIEYWKAKDNRRVYTGASVGNSWPLVFENEYMVKAGARGLTWADRRPESDSDYNAVVERYAVPYITHEMGQWCVFPNFEEINKYRGAYKAKNFELFKAELEAHGMGKNARNFLMASGALQKLCYKHEIEKALRTKGLAGFQLLGLQDFPGQGTALVGMLDAFWDPKPYLAESDPVFCAPVVPLIRTPKFVYTNDETLTANVELFNFGEGTLKGAEIRWILFDSAAIVQQGAFKRKDYVLGNCLPVGKIEIPLLQVKEARAFRLQVSVAGTPYFNAWNFYVFPARLPVVQPTVHYCDNLDEKAIAVLDSGGTVFLQAAGKIVKGREIVNYFTPVFWNTSWFKMRPPHTLGFYCDPKHPAFAQFPTSYHSDLQWWEIVNRTQVMHLEDFPAAFQPILQPIDTWFINRKLAMLLEARVGKGKLLITTIDFKNNMPERPAARQLLYSLQNYVQSDKFNPVNELPLATIQALFTTPSYEIWNGYTKDAPDELKTRN